MRSLHNRAWDLVRLYLAKILKQNPINYFLSKNVYLTLFLHKL